MTAYTYSPALHASSFRRLYVFALLCNFVFAYEAAMAEYGVATIAANLGADPVQASGFLFWYFLATAAGVAGAPYIASQIHSLRGVSIGVMTGLGVMLAGSMVRSTVDFNVVRIVMGLLAANVGVFLGTFISQCTLAEERTEVFGGTSLGIGLGYLCAPVAIALSLKMTGTWRYAYASGMLGMASVLWLAWSLRDQQPATYADGTRGDAGDLLSLVCLVALLTCAAFLLHPSSPLGNGPWALVLLFVGAVALCGVVWTSGRCDHPALDIQLVRHARAGFLLLATMLSFCATFLVAFIAPYLALYSVSARAETGVLLLAAFPIGFAVGGALASSLLKAVPAGRLALWAHAGCGLAALAGAWLVRNDSPAVLAITYLAGGTLRGLTIAPMSTLTTMLVPVYRLSSFLSTVTVFRSMGMLAGIGVAAQAWKYFGISQLLLTLAEGEPQRAVVAQHASLTYLAAAALYALACVLLFKYRRLK